MVSVHRLGEQAERNKAAIGSLILAAEERDRQLSMLAKQQAALEEKFDDQCVNSISGNIKGRADANDERIDAILEYALMPWWRKLGSRAAFLRSYFREIRRAHN